MLTVSISKGQEWGYLMRSKERGAYSKLMRLVPKMLIACLILKQNDYARVNIFRQWQHRYWVDKGLPFPAVFDEDISLLYEETGERSLSMLRATITANAGTISTAEEVVDKLNKDFRELGAARSRKDSDANFAAKGRTTTSNTRSDAAQVQVNRIRIYLGAMLKNAVNDKLIGFSQRLEFYDRSVVQSEEYLQVLRLVHVADLIPEMEQLRESLASQFTGVLNRYRDGGEQQRILDFRATYKLVCSDAREDAVEDEEDI